MDATTTATAALTLTKTAAEFYPPAERDREHTSRTLSTSVLVFHEPEDAVDYLVTHKGLTETRARLVIARRCEFHIEPADGLAFTTYKFTA